MSSAKCHLSHKTVYKYNMYITDITHYNLLNQFTPGTSLIWSPYVHAIHQTFSLGWLEKSKGSLSGVISMFLLSLAYCHNKWQA